jgi:Na+/proline symporter
MVTIITLYLAVLFAIIVFAGPLRKGDAPKSLVDEQYLAGRKLGPAVLGVSVCASMFSGYTVIGIPAESFSNGFSAWRWIGSCTFISLVYLAYSPRLYRLARAKGYSSVLDVVRDRYQLDKSSGLYWALIFVYLVPCGIYTWNQFVAFSNTVNALFAIPKAVGSFGLCVLLVLYEVVGGLRAVAWTDLLQGCVLVTGAMAFLLPPVIGKVYGGLETVSESLLETDPSHVTVMDSGASISWAEFWFSVGFGRAMFPDYVARVMAAESEKTLRTAQLVLLAAPFFVQMPLCLVGLCGRVAYPDEENPKAIFSLVVRDVINSGVFGRVFGSISFAASLAAIMSTADSCLIAVSHMITLDVLKPLLAGPRDPVSGQPASAEEQDKKLLMVGRGVTLVLAIVCAGTAVLDGFSLSFMIQFQFAFLSQCFPAMVLGLYFPSLSEKSVLAGLVVGLPVGVLGVWYKFPAGIFGFSAGFSVIISIVLNVVVVFAASVVLPNTKGVPSGFGFDEKAREIVSAVTSSGDLRKEPVGAVKPLLLGACIVPFLAIPFYRESGATDDLIFGVPVWAACSLLVLALSHAFIAVILIVGWDVNEPDSSAYEQKVILAEPEKTGVPAANPVGIPDDASTYERTTRL